MTCSFVAVLPRPTMDSPGQDSQFVPCDTGDFAWPVGSWSFGVLLPKEDAMSTLQLHRYRGQVLGLELLRRLTQESDTGFKDITVDSVETLMTALTQRPPFPVTIEANSALLQLLLLLMSCGSGTVRSSLTRFLSPVMALMAARIVGPVQDHIRKVMPPKSFLSVSS